MCQVYATVPVRERRIGCSSLTFPTIFRIGKINCNQEKGCPTGRSAETDYVGIGWLIIPEEARPRYRTHLRKCTADGRAGVRIHNQPVPLGSSVRGAGFLGVSRSARAWPACRGLTMDGGAVTTDRVTSATALGAQPSVWGLSISLGPPGTGPQSATVLVAAVPWPGFPAVTRGAR
jgi:hypothetical protein